MPYLGSQLARGFATTTKQSFSGDASTVAFTLTRNAGQATDLEVFVDNVQQEPTTAYGVSGTTLTFTAAPSTGTNNIYVIHRGGGSTGNLPPQDLGATDYIFRDDISFKSDSAKINFGADSDITLTHVADTGLILKNTHTSGNSGIGAILTLQTGDTDVAANNVLGQIDFQAPDEGTGTDAILKAASIQAVSEGDFSSSSNATSIVLNTASTLAVGSAADGGKLTLNSTGDLTLKDLRTADGSSPTITLQSGDTDIAADDVLGTINFQAPDEGAGTDAILVAAGIAAVSEGDFSSSSNATSLIFKTGASAAADEKMRIDSAGNVGIGTNNPDSTLTMSDTVPIIKLIDSDDNTFSRVYHSAGKLLFDADKGDTGSGSTIQFGVDDTERMRIDSSGNLLVGKTSTDFGTAGATYAAAGNASLVTNGGSALFLNRLQEGGMIELYEAGTARGQIDIASDRILVRSVGDASGLRFDAASYTPFKNGSQSDDAVDLGFGSGRFDDLFATNGTIQTSDRNDKQDIAALTSKEMLVAKRISTLFKTFRWKTKVAEKAAKGETARTHTGVIAQDVQDAFTAEGLDAGDYSLFIESPWWEKDVEVAAVEANEDEGIEAADAYTKTNKWASEDEAPEGSTKKTRLGMRYPELLSFLAAYNEQRFAAIETRLTALEDA